MMQDSRQKDFICGALIGGAIATLTSLLFTTKKGKEIQHKIADTYEDVKEKVEDKVMHAKDLVEEKIYDVMKEKVEDKLSHAKEKAEEGVDHLHKKVTEKAKHVDHKDSK